MFQHGNRVKTLREQFGLIFVHRATRGDTGRLNFCAPALNDHQLAPRNGQRLHSVPLYRHEIHEVE